MATLNPLRPYSPEELASLYPSHLQLHLVQVIFRHGERTPISSRFQNAGLQSFWPYCHAALRFKAAVLDPNTNWNSLPFQRVMETFGENGESVVAKGPGGETAGICSPGELTDRGRETTLQLGQRLRHLYVHQLGFLPKKQGDQSEYYLRSSSIVRALESLQQVFTGLYPARTDTPLTIHMRPFPDENIAPNAPNCRRFLQLSQAFAELAAKKWNASPEMQYLQSRIGKFLPPGGTAAVDGHPRLSGIMDTVNSSLAHAPATRLPGEFYEPRVREILNDVNIDEWYRGFAQSSEYRRLGVGSLLGDVKDRMISSMTSDHQSRMKIALMGCHDTTVAGILASLGAFDNIWPPFTSSIAIELFREKQANHTEGTSILAGLSARAPKKEPEAGWYVRLRYNDKPVVVKGCKPPGKHLPGDESFCTLSAFKQIVEKLAPKDWKSECMRNLDKPGIPPVEVVE